MTGSLATVAVVYRRPEAAVLLSMLNAYGIPAFAATWHTTNAAPHWTVLVGGIAVLVPVADLEAAIALVGDPNALPLPPRDFRGGRVANLLIALVFGLLPILLMGDFGYVPPPRARGSYARAA